MEKNFQNLSLRLCFLHSLFNFSNILLEKLESLNTHKLSELDFCLTFSEIPQNKEKNMLEKSCGFGVYF